MGLSCGIVGLPNVGKSTLFNALTKLNVEASNYPFCTIDPSHGVVPVEDARLEVLSKISSSKKTIPATVEFVDIAGLVKGASNGEGLGNQFLSHIRESNAIIQVLRLFEEENIAHTEGRLNPIEDFKTIETELILSDLLFVEKQMNNLEKKIKRTAEKADILEKTILEKIKSSIEKEIPVRKQTFLAEEIPVLKKLNLLTAKPQMVVGNLSEEQIGKSPAPLEERVLDFVKAENLPYIRLSAALEEEISKLDDNDKKDFLKSYGLEKTAINHLILSAYKLLDFVTFFTTGEAETKAWTILNNTLAPDAAGVIHSDFKKNFIKAEVVSCKTLEQLGSYTKCREKGASRIEGKNYLVKDGDVCIFKVNTNK